jgi:methionyl aminopeptidase
MISLKSDREISLVREACRIVAEILGILKGEVKPGITTRDLDAIAERLIKEKGAKPAFKGYRGYPAVLCASVNEEVVHGIPGSRKLEEGQIISLDLGVILNGFYGDMAATYPVGIVSPEDSRLIQVTHEALEKGVIMSKPGNRLGDVSAAIQSHVEANGFSVVRDFVGHGIGRQLHEEPQVPNFGSEGTGIRLKKGMVFCLEPMVNAGEYGIRIKEDGWTAVTADSRKSAHFEHTVAVLENDNEVLTK